MTDQIARTFHWIAEHLAGRCDFCAVLEFQYFCNGRYMEDHWTMGSNQHQSGVRMENYPIAAKPTLPDLMPATLMLESSGVR